MTENITDLPKKSFLTKINYKNVAIAATAVAAVTYVVVKVKNGSSPVADVTEN